MINDDYEITVYELLMELQGYNEKETIHYVVNNLGLFLMNKTLIVEPKYVSEISRHYRNDLVSLASFENGIYQLKIIKIDYPNYFNYNGIVVDKRSIECHNNRIEDYTIISQILTNVERMDLSFNTMKSKELMKACSYAMNLKYLSLSYNDISNDDLRILSNYNRRMIQLVLKKCNLSSYNVDVIKKIIKRNKSLQLLDLEENDFSDDDIEAIEISDKCQEIEYPQSENYYYCNEANVAGIDIGSYYIKLYSNNCYGKPIDLDIGNGVSPFKTRLTNKEIPYVFNVVGLDNVIGKYSKEYECHSPIKIRNNDGETEFSFDEKNDKYISLDEIMSKILRSVHKSIKERSGHSDNDVSLVFTIPIDFEEEQKEKIRNWSEKSGIKVVYFLYQPVAAAISYCYNNKMDHPFELFVCDFGATHYSFTLLKIDPVRKIYRITKHRKNDKIGGNLFTEKIADYFLTRWEEIPFENNDRRNLSKRKYRDVIHRSENVKVELSSALSVDCDCSLFETDNYNISHITEAAMNETLRQEFDVFDNELEQFINENRQSFDSLRDAIGVGGVIRMNYVKEMLEKRINGCLISTSDVNACGYGACLFASNIDFQMAEAVDYGRSVNVVLNDKLICQFVHRFHSDSYEITKYFDYKYNVNDECYIELVLNDSEVLNVINVTHYVRTISSHMMSIPVGIKVDNVGNIKVYFNTRFITSF